MDKTAGAAALTPTQTALLNPTVNPRLPYNVDSWDGNPSQREALLQAVRAQDERLVALSGDSHHAWFTNLTTLAGVKAGVEFAGSSVTAPGFESAGLGSLASSLDGSALKPQLGNAAIGASLGLIDDLNDANTIRRGYRQRCDYLRLTGRESHGNASSNGSTTAGIFFGPGQGVKVRAGRRGSPSAGLPFEPESGRRATR